MKKFLTVGALVLTAAALSASEAQAWCNFKFGAGINMSVQSGGNTLLWGAFRNGQPPAPPPGGFNPYYGGYAPGPMAGPGPGPFGPFGAQQPDGGFQYYGNLNGNQFPQFAPQGMAPQVAPTNPTPAQAPAAVNPATAYWQQGGLYQPVSFGHGYPGYDLQQNYQQQAPTFVAPYYWYGYGN